jgi:hypothetical protein
MAKKTEKAEMAEKSTTSEGKLKALGLAMDHQAIWRWIDYETWRGSQS